MCSVSGKGKKDNASKLNLFLAFFPLFEHQGLLGQSTTVISESVKDI